MLLAASAMAGAVPRPRRVREGLATGELALASTAEDGTKGDGGSFDGNLGADGNRVASVSVADNLGEGDTTTGIP